MVYNDVVQRSVAKVDIALAVLFVFFQYTYYMMAGSKEFLYMVEKQNGRSERRRTLC